MSDCSPRHTLLQGFRRLQSRDLQTSAQARIVLSWLPVDRRHLFGAEVPRHNDLQHLDIRAVTELSMANGRRPVNTRTRFQPHSALSFVFELRGPQ